MTVPNRNYSSPSYRYGFQGQEKDDEIKEGDGNSINYKFRMHDPRVGRFFARDPLSHKFTWNSSYAFSENRVIDGIELEGLEVWFGTHSNQIEYESQEARNEDLNKARIQGSVNVFKSIYKSVKERYEKPKLLASDALKIINTTKVLLEGKINVIDVGKKIIDDRKKRLANSPDPEMEYNAMLGEDLTKVSLSVLADKGIGKLIKITKLPITKASPPISIIDDIVKQTGKQTATVTMTRSQLLVRGSIQKTLGKSKGVYKFTMTDGTIYIGQAQGLNGFAQRTKRSLIELVEGTSKKAAKTPGKTLDKVEFYTIDSRIDKSVNAMERRFIQGENGIENLLNQRNAPRTD